MADNFALRTEASNPTTDPARLAAIAHEDPSLGATVAANPAAYDALLDWLLQYGDDEAKRAVGVRRGTYVAPAPLIAPVAPAGYGTAAPAAKAPASPGLKKGLLFGGIGLAVVAVVAIAAVVVVNVIGGGGSSASGINIVEIANEPRDDAWEIITPLVEDAGKGEYLSANVQTVGQDRALVFWSSNDDESDSQADPLTSLIDTRSGAVLWTIDDFEYGASVISPPGVTPYLVLSDSEISAIDPGSGDIISDSSKLDDVSLLSTGAISAATLSFGSDVILRSEDGIGRYPANALDEEKWLIDWDDSDDYPQLAGNRVIIGDEAYSTDTGEQVDWEAGDDLNYLGVGSYILGGESDSDGEIVRFSETGEELWSYDMDDANFVFAEGNVLILARGDDEELVSLNLDSGEENWVVDADFGGGSGGGGMGSLSAGVLFVAAGDEYELTAFDIASGDELYSFDYSDKGDWYISILGMTSRTYYAAGGEDNDLIAYDIRTGDEKWSLNNPDSYTFALAGGQIIGVQSRDADDAEDDPTIIGIQP